MPKVTRSTILDVPCDEVWAMVRDFNGFGRWIGSIGASSIERGHAAEKIGCVRRLRLSDGSELREQLLTLSDLEQTMSYCLLDTPIPLFNYVAHIRLLPVTDGNRTFWHWHSTFTTRAEDAERLSRLVGEDIYMAGFEGVRRMLQQAA
jgi:hypothetical protein